jgi:hypothetical protein
MIMGVHLLGWLGNELTLRIAVIAGDISAWLALALFAFSLVCTLAAAIVGSCRCVPPGKGTRAALETSLQMQCARSITPEPTVSISSGVKFPTELSFRVSRA